MELATEILKKNKYIDLDTESSLVYPTAKRNDIVVRDSRYTSCSISYSYEIKCHTLNQSVLSFSQKVTLDIIKSLDVISDVHCTEVVAMFCNWNDMDGETFCIEVFNTLASCIANANITSAPGQNIKCVTFENIKSPVNRGNRILTDVVFVYIDVIDLIHRKSPSEIRHNYENIQTCQIQNEVSQRKYGTPRCCYRNFY